MQNVLGVNVRRLRRKNHLSQTELGKRLGVSVFEVSKIERGAVNPSIEKIKQMAEIFHVTPMILIGKIYLKEPVTTKDWIDHLNLIADLQSDQVLLRNYLYEYMYQIDNEDLLEYVKLFYWKVVK